MTEDPAPVLMLVGPEDDTAWISPLVVGSNEIVGWTGMDKPENVLLETESGLALLPAPTGDVGSAISSAWLSEVEADNLPAADPVAVGGMSTLERGHIHQAASINNPTKAEPNKPIKNADRGRLKNAYYHNVRLDSKSVVKLIAGPMKIHQTSRLRQINFTVIKPNPEAQDECSMFDTSQCSCGLRVEINSPISGKSGGSSLLIKAVYYPGKDNIALILGYINVQTHETRWVFYSNLETSTRTMRLVICHILTNSQIREYANNSGCDQYWYTAPWLESYHHKVKRPSKQKTYNFRGWKAMWQIVSVPFYTCSKNSDVDNKVNLAFIVMAFNSMLAITHIRHKNIEVEIEKIWPPLQVPRYSCKTVEVSRDVVHNLSTKEVDNRSLWSWRDLLDLKDLPQYQRAERAIDVRRQTNAMSGVHRPIGKDELYYQEDKKSIKTRICNILERYLNK